MIDIHRIKAICFDAGNVLIGLNFDRVQEILGQLGFAVEHEQFRDAELAGRDRINQAILESNAGSNRQHGYYYYDEILGRLGVPRERRDEVADEILRNSTTCNLWNWSPAETRHVLDELRARGYRLAVISNSDGTCEQTLSNLGLADAFEFIVDSRLVAVEKPDPRIFALAAERLGLLPGSILYVGDLYHIDIIGSQEAGFQSALMDPRQLCAFGDCFVIPRLSALLDHLPPL